MTKNAQEIFINDINMSYIKNKNTIDEIANDISTCEGNIIFTGIGKSALIGEKCAATFRSLGIKSFFLHSTDLAHGDLGGISVEDIVFCISQSGSTSELIYVLDHIKESCKKVISVTGNEKSVLFLKSDLNLDTTVTQELCKLNLAPTASTSVALFLIDLVAIETSQKIGIDSSDFAKSHPAGKLGKSLNLSVESIMEDSTSSTFDINEPKFKNILNALIKGGLGIAIGINEHNIPEAIFTDGDFRRLFADGISNIDEKTELKVSNKFSSFFANQLVREVHAEMTSKKIISAPILNEEGILVGIINSRILLANGFEL